MLKIALAHDSWITECKRRTLRLSGLILRYIEIDGSNDRHKYKSTTSPTQYVLLDRAREGSLKKSYVRNMRKTNMTGDHPKQIRVIASSGAKLRAGEEEELMPSREQC